MITIFIGTWNMGRSSPPSCRLPSGSASCLRHPQRGRGNLSPPPQPPCTASLLGNPNLFLRKWVRGMSPGTPVPREPLSGSWCVSESDSIGERSCTSRLGAPGSLPALGSSPRGPGLKKELLGVAALTEADRQTERDTEKQRDGAQLNLNFI